MYYNSGGPRNDPTGVRVHNGNHFADRLYRKVVTNLLEGINRIDFDVDTFARNLMANSNVQQKQRVMEMVVAIINAGSESYEMGDFSDGPTTAKRLKDTVDLYEM